MRSFIENIGLLAEHRVFVALKTLPSPWQVFHTVEWRILHWIRLVLDD